MWLWAEALKDQWSNGVFQKDTAERTAEANAAGVAQTEVIEKFIDLNYAQLKEGLTDDYE